MCSGYVRFSQFSNENMIEKWLQFGSVHVTCLLLFKYRYTRVQNVTLRDSEVKSKLMADELRGNYNGCSCCSPTLAQTGSSGDIQVMVHCYHFLVQSVVQRILDSSSLATISFILSLSCLVKMLSMTHTRKAQQYTALMSWKHWT